MRGRISCLEGTCRRVIFRERRVPQIEMPILCSQANSQTRLVYWAKKMELLFVRANIKLSPRISNCLPQPPPSPLHDVLVDLGVEEDEEDEGHDPEDEQPAPVVVRSVGRVRPQLRHLQPRFKGHHVARCGVTVDHFVVLGGGVVLPPDLLVDDVGGCLRQSQSRARPAG